MAFLPCSLTNRCTVFIVRRSLCTISGKNSYTLISLRLVAQFNKVFTQFEESQLYTYIYEGKDAFLWLTTSFGKSSTLRGAIICVLNLKQSEILTGQGSYTVILLLLPLESLTIAKFNGVSVHCFVEPFFSALYVYYFRISCPYIIARGQST